MQEELGIQYIIIPAPLLLTFKIPTHTHLVSLFEAEAEVDELEALVISAPENVTWLEVSMDVAFSMKEGESLQDVSGTVLDKPHGVALLGSAKTNHTMKLNRKVQTLLNI